MIPDPDPQMFLRINGFARDTSWLHPIMTCYADYGIVVFAALLLAGGWIARRHGDLTLLAAAVLIAGCLLLTKSRSAYLGFAVGVGLVGACEHLPRRLDRSGSAVEAEWPAATGQSAWWRRWKRRSRRAPSPGGDGKSP